MIDLLSGKTFDPASLNEGVLFVDIGGTRIRVASFVDGAIRVTMEQKAGNSILEILQQIKSAVSSSYATIKEIRVACPGLVNMDGGVGAALHSAVRETNLQQYLTKELHIPSFVYNDAYAQALGLPKFNKASLFISLGTSIGGAYLPVDSPIRGCNGYGGEIGHLPTSYAEGRCRCGRKHCLDLVASGWSLERDLGNEWWKSMSEIKEQRVVRACRAIAEVSHLLMPFSDHGVLVIAGKLVKHELFRNALQTACADNLSVWPSVQVKYVSEYEALTWNGLCQTAFIH